MSFIAKTNIFSGLSYASFGPIFFHKKKGLTKAQRKKLMMRKRRIFVDNIIMHHKRLHDQNREKAIEETKNKIDKNSSLVKTKSKPAIAPKLTRSSSSKTRSGKWQSKVQDRTSLQKERVKGMVDNIKQKSRSKWTVKVKDGGGNREV